MTIRLLNQPPDGKAMETQADKLVQLATETDPEGRELDIFEAWFHATRLYLGAARSARKDRERLRLLKEAQTCCYRLGAAADIAGHSIQEEISALE